MNAFWGGLNRGEQLLFVGATLIFVFADVIVGLITGVGVNSAIVICAVITLVAIYLEHSRADTSWPYPYPILLLILTVIVVVLALNDVIDAIHTGLFQNESALDLLAILAVWLGAALMGAGWWLGWGGGKRA